MNESEKKDAGRKSLLNGIRNYILTCLSFSEGLKVSESDPQDEGLRTIRDSLLKAKTAVENELSTRR